MATVRDNKAQSRFELAGVLGVDGRDKPGHDEGEGG
jgi:hypothetical protein